MDLINYEIWIVYQKADLELKAEKITTWEQALFTFSLMLTVEVVFFYSNIFANGLLRRNRAKLLWPN